MNKKTVRDVDIKGKKVLVRCDFNVPLDENGNITDNRRIVEALETIKYLLSNGAKVILCSHLGRPKGQFKPEFSLAPVAKELSILLGQEVKLAGGKDIVGSSAKNLANSLGEGEAMLLENVRFDAREEENDPEFAKELAGFADIYVNDAFGTAHRAHATTAGVAEYLPAVSGFLIEKELNFLGDALNNPKRPFVVILGGKKVSDKIGVIESLIEKADKIIIVGAMSYTFLKAKGHSIGKSLCEDNKLDFVKELCQKAEKKGVEIVIPIDTRVANEVSQDANSKIVGVSEISEEDIGLDIGPETEKMIAKEIKNAETVFWNGPAGVFEIDQFAQGTISIANSLAESNAISIIGGGDSSAAVKKAGVEDRITFISTGGGASMEFIEGKDLPGIVCLDEKGKENPKKVLKKKQCSRGKDDDDDGR